MLLKIMVSWDVTPWIYLFIYGLVNKIFSSSDYLVLNDRVLNESWIGKDVEAIIA
jgi:hypothetical protein